MSVCSVRVGSFLEAAVVPSTNSPAYGVTEDLRTMMDVLYYVVVVGAIVAVVWGYAAWRRGWRKKTICGMVGTWVWIARKIICGGGGEKATRGGGGRKKKTPDGKELLLLEREEEEEEGGGEEEGGDVAVLESQLQMVREEVARLWEEVQTRREAEKQLQEALRAQEAQATRRLQAERDHAAKSIQEVQEQLLRERRRWEEHAARSE
jgi:hypothetical protein